MKESEGKRGIEGYRGSVIWGMDTEHYLVDDHGEEGAYISIGESRERLKRGQR